MNKKKSLNPVPKSLRIRKRYVLFECRQYLTKKQLLEFFRQQLLELYGAVGFGQANFVFLRYNQKTGLGIISVERSWEKKIIPFFVFLEKKGLKVYPKKVSGTVKSLKKDSS